MMHAWRIIKAPEFTAYVNPSGNTKKIPYLPPPSPTQPGVSYPEVLCIYMVAQFTTPQGPAPAKQRSEPPSRHTVTDSFRLRTARPNKLRATKPCREQV